MMDCRLEEYEVKMEVAVPPQAVTDGFRYPLFLDSALNSAFAVTNPLRRRTNSNLRHTESSFVRMYAKNIFETSDMPINRAW